MTEQPKDVASPPGAAVKLAATLPKTDANGLADWANLLVHDPRQLRYAVIAFDVARVIDDLDSGTDTAVVRIQRIEPLPLGEATSQAQELMEKAAAARGNNGQIHFEEADDD